MSKTKDLIYIALSAALIGLCAWIVIPFGIPFTMQTFAVCLIGATFGAKKGILAVLIYILMGICGLPVFSGFRAGIAPLTDLTGGYIIGFIFTAIIAGLGNKYNNMGITAMFMAFGILVCYIFGTLWVVLIHKINFTSALSMCVLPFIIPDGLKILLASVISKRLKRALK